MPAKDHTAGTTSLWSPAVSVFGARDPALMRVTLYYRFAAPNIELIRLLAIIFAFQLGFPLLSLRYEGDNRLFELSKLPNMLDSHVKLWISCNS